MNSTLEAYFRSLHPRQIIPAAPVKADSRIELSVKPHRGWGGLSASKSLAPGSPLWTAALIRKSKAGSCWLFNFLWEGSSGTGSFKSRLPICTARQASTDLPTSTHSLFSCYHRRHSGSLQRSCTCSTSLPSPAVFISCKMDLKSSCSGVLAQTSASISFAVSAMPPPHGSLYIQLHHSGRSSRGQQGKLTNKLKVWDQTRRVVVLTAAKME